VEVPAFASKELKSLLEVMLEKDPRRRATIGDVKRHKWLNYY
jgi:serine/threonine protein kinase